MDIMVAVGIFIMAIVVFYIYSLNRPDELKENFENLFQDGKIITDNLLSMKVTCPNSFSNCFNSSIKSYMSGIYDFLWFITSLSV